MRGLGLEPLIDHEPIVVIRGMALVDAAPRPLRDRREIFTQGPIHRNPRPRPSAFSLSESFHGAPRRPSCPAPTSPPPRMRNQPSVELPGAEAGRSTS